MTGAADRRPIRPLAAVPDAGPEDPSFALFLAGDRATIRRAMQIVSAVVRFRGYFIPAGERTDLEQDTLLQLWRAIGSPAFARGAGFDGLVRAVAYRRCIDWRRTRRATVSLDVDPADRAESPDRAMQRSQEEEIGRRIIAGMRGPCRELFRLRSVEGLDYGAIAASSGRSETALRAQMSACLKEARLEWTRLQRTGRNPARASRSGE